MVFLNTGSRRTNPYSNNKRGSSISWRIYNSVPPKTWGILAIIVTIWFLTIVLVVEENPTIKKEVLTDIQREENIIKGKIKRGRLRAKEWLKHHLVDEDSDIQASDALDKQHEWDLTQLEDLALRTGPGDTLIHVIFSTDCSPYQQWQSYQFFVSALRIRQPGRVTQIASGCTEEEKQSLIEWHSKHIQPLSLRFELHLTPHFSSVKDANGKATDTEYEFFNKPFGLLHWMENSLGIDPETQTPWKHDTIIALLDPDQLLIRPITGYFESPNDIFRGGDSSGGENVDSNLSLFENKPTFVVRHGHPASQEYGYRNAWTKYSPVAGFDSPATKVTTTEALRSYALGPPYIATARDMYSIAVNWAAFVPEVHTLFPELLAEMYAFSIATAHLKLPHQLMASLMVSDTSTSGAGDDGGGEGWKLVDVIPGDDVCSFAMNSLDTEKYPLPNVLHFCHRYGVGDKDFFAKKKLPTDFFTCESPLLAEPSLDIGSGKYKYKKPPFLDKKVEYSAVVEKREAFMICASIGFLNEAALFYKKKHCDEDTANTTKELSLHDLPE